MFGVAGVCPFAFFRLDHLLAVFAAVQQVKMQTAFAHLLLLLREWDAK